MERLRQLTDQLTTLPFVDAVDILRKAGQGRPSEVVLHTPRGDYRLEAEVRRTALSYAVVDRVLDAQGRRRVTSDTDWILLAPYVSPRMSAYLAEHGVNFIDEVGNCRLMLDDGYVALGRTHGSARSAKSTW